MRDHNKLRAFELADEIVVQIYKVTSGFPKQEMFGITSQMRRSAVSVASNIVEGCSRSTQRDFSRFLEIAFGSLRELSYQFGLSNRLGYIKSTDFETTNPKLIETEKVLGALLRSVKQPLNR